MTDRQASLLLVVAIGACIARPASDHADTSHAGGAVTGDASASSPALPPGDSASTPVPRSACRAVGSPGTPASDRELGLPATMEGILGLITQVRAPNGKAESFHIRVEQDPRRSAGTPQAVIVVPPTARVVQRVGHRASPAELRICQEVRVWFDGPVAESFPVQAKAGVIVIERILEQVPNK